MRPLIARMSVLLPQPDGPATRSTSPASTVRSRSRSAGSVARRYRKVSPWMSTIRSGMVGPRLRSADPDPLIDAGAEATRRVGLVVGVAEPTGRVLVEHRRPDGRLAERAHPRDLLDVVRGAVDTYELHAEAGPWRGVAERAGQVLAAAGQVEVAERGDEDDGCLEHARGHDRRREVDAD